MLFTSHYSQSIYQVTARSEACSQDCPRVRGEGGEPKTASSPRLGDAHFSPSAKGACGERFPYTHPWLLNDCTLI